MTCGTNRNRLRDMHNICAKNVNILTDNKLLTYKLQFKFFFHSICSLPSAIITIHILCTKKRAAVQHKCYCFFSIGDSQ